MRNGPAIHRGKLHDGRETWLVTGHAEARRLLADPRISADRRREGFPLPAPGKFPPAALGDSPPFIFVDQPEHTYRRRMVISEFTARRLKDLRPGIEQIIEDTLDPVLAAGSPTNTRIPTFRLAVPVNELRVHRPDALQGVYELAEPGAGGTAGGHVGVVREDPDAAARGAGGPTAAPGGANCR